MANKNNKHMKKLYLLFIFVLYTSSYIFATNHRDSIDVIHYNINLSILNISSKNIKASTYITLTPKFNNTFSFKLDLQKLTVSKLSLKNAKLKSWSQNDSLITIFLKKKINKKDTIIVLLKYNGTPIKDAEWGGFYFSQKDAFNMGVGMASIPHSFGRAWFPCNDIFTDKATYEYHITVNKKNIAACGGLLISSYEKKDTRTFYWKQDKPISTYLASVDISDYSIIRTNYKGIKRNIPIEIFAFKNNVEKTKKSLINLKSAVNIFEKLFGPYAWDKIGYSEVSFADGAMEHAGNIAMSSYAFDGTTKNETLLYHELSHSWFGNLVTCKSAKDMWLNEGWASYCEALFLEKMYGKQRFRNFNRRRHFQVLFLAHRIDQGYRSVANMDLSHTYGTTVYKKGADIVHTLRFYLTDSLFFPAVKKYLQKYAYSNASTEDLKNTLSKETGVNLDDFFNFWLYSPAFPFFEISDWHAEKTKDNNYKVSVKMTQRLIGGNKLANSNRIEVFFMDSDFNTQKRIFKFSGDSAWNNFDIPFKPVLVMPDLYEHTEDATIDKYTFIIKKGDYAFNECLFDAEVKNITDTSFLRVTCNCIAPPNSENPKLLLQKNYYWTIEGLWNKNFQAIGKFYLTRLMDLNFTKLFARKKITLVFRKSSKENWHETKFKLIDNYIETNLKTGQYALAVKI